MSDRTELLRSIFTNPAFVWLNRWLGYIAVDGVKIGVVAATLNPGYFEHALNKDSEERLLASKSKGKMDEAYTVFASLDKLYRHTYTGHRDAEELHQKILAMGLQPRAGRFGEFYTLPSILTMGDDAPM